MKRITSGPRCCPKCSGTTFDKIECSTDKEALDGHRLKCVACGWLGFALQLVKKED